MFCYPPHYPRARSISRLISVRHSMVLQRTENIKGALRSPSRPSAMWLAAANSVQKCRDTYNSWASNRPWPPTICNLPPLS
ncbi:hypothetical protein VUR80DRAFT_9452 [Thermomyces stellatus]